MTGIVFLPVCEDAPCCTGIINAVIVIKKNVRLRTTKAGTVKCSYGNE